MDGAATDAEMAVAPMPTSTAPRTASFDGSSSAIFKRVSTPAAMAAASKMERVPDPCSRSTHSLSGQWPASTRRALAQGWSGPTTTTSLGGVADAQAHVHAWIGTPERDEVPWQPVARDGLAGMHVQGAALQAAQLGEGAFGAIGPRQHRPGFTQEQGTGICQRDAAPDAVEELGTVSSLQACDSGADRRLGHVERFGRARDMASLIHGHEDAELLQRHARLTRAG